MTVEIAEVADFICQFAPFDHLSTEIIAEISQHVEVQYHRQGSVILELDQEIHHLYMVRSGVVELYRNSGKLQHRLASGDIFGQKGLLLNHRVKMPATAKEDCLLYCIDAGMFDWLLKHDAEFASFVEIESRIRLQQAVSKFEENSFTGVKVKSLITRELVTLTRTDSITCAAQLMAAQDVSCLLITDPDKPISDADNDDQVIGMITDKDFRTQVVAAGIDSSLAVDTIMTTGLVQVDSNAYVFEAMMIMLKYKLKYLPIVKARRTIGILAMSDLVRYESQSSLLLVQSIWQRQSRDELAEMRPLMLECFSRLVEQAANSHMIGSAMAVIGRNVIQKLIDLFEQEHGCAPAPFAFMILGSMARDEQLPVTDQDHAIILADDISDSQRLYFNQLAQFVSDGMSQCGFSYCRGGIMATNPKWQMTLAQWESRFCLWIDNPSHASLLDANIFFDLDCVYGRQDWVDELNSVISRRAKRNNRFLAAMAYNALNRTPPLGFFRGFVMEQDGRHRNIINLKRRGTAPLADLIRVHALAVGSRAQNSFDRLDDIISAGILPKGRGEDLRAAMECISLVRIRQQALAIRSGEELNNDVLPDNLSEFERRTLKDAFQVLSHAQKFLKFRYQPNRSL
ncbi:cyclic nucleotide-binding/CBS domain-containing protein [Shewanella sp. SNU WT4]|uniref:putative nucleotidyltransferase substrate binding domain-containing protein n=1 Tax=Shewanella sp. SNU WT4 TaxID=2590015 RepID=UPI00112986DC|nr:putative nucleotidyltransferase substrate binding domain-containing protein [Shewanella sp. SNU WT4]QDF67005.1 cyclic nucleotide-binding/CBS domain-containing protein [Shewanella sp. SNU WT4]